MSKKNLTNKTVKLRRANLHVRSTRKKRLPALRKKRKSKSSVIKKKKIYCKLKTHAKRRNATTNFLKLRKIRRLKINASCSRLNFCKKSRKSKDSWKKKPKRRRTK